MLMLLKIQTFASNIMPDENDMKSLLKEFINTDFFSIKWETTCRNL